MIERNDPLFARFVGDGNDLADYTHRIIFRHHKDGCETQTGWYYNFERKLTHESPPRPAENDQSGGGLQDLADFPALQRQADQNCPYGEQHSYDGTFVHFLGFLRGGIIPFAFGIGPVRRIPTGGGHLESTEHAAPKLHDP